MGLIIDADENDYGLSFEIRRESVIFHFNEEVEISKEDLLLIEGMISNPTWRGKIFDDNWNERTLLTKKMPKVKP